MFKVVSLVFLLLLPLLNCIFFNMCKCKNTFPKNGLLNTIFMITIYITLFFTSTLIFNARIVPLILFGSLFVMGLVHKLIYLNEITINTVKSYEVCIFTLVIYLLYYWMGAFDLLINNF